MRASMIALAFVAALGLAATIEIGSDQTISSDPLCGD